MSEELSFSLLEKAHKDNSLIEKFHLSWFNQEGRPVKKTKINSKSHTYYTSVFLPLDKNEFIYCKSPLQEFYLSYSVLIGDKTPLYKATFLKGGIVYVEESNIEDIKDMLIHSTIKSVDVKEIFGKKIKWNYEKPKVLREINNYVKEKKELDLNEIHIQKGDKVELFVPTLKQKHFELAKKMHLPLFSLISKGFFNDTTLNIFDSQSLLKELNAYKSEKISITTKEGKNGELIYRDVEKQLHILLPTDSFLEILDSLECRNVSKETLIEELHKRKTIQIGSRYYQTIELPVWKSSKGIVTFEDEKEFEKHAGLSYRNKMNKLESIYLIDSKGDPLHFPNYYLNTSLKGLLTSYHPPLLHFSTFDELFALMYIYEEKFPFSIIVKSFQVDNKKIEEISSICSKIIESILKESLSTITLPKPTKPATPLELMISHYTQELNAVRNTYLEQAKEALVELTSQYSQRIIHYIKKFPINSKTSYFYLEFSRELVKTLIFLDKQYEHFEKTLEEYFKQVRSTYHLPLNDQEISTYNLTILAEELSKKYEIFILPLTKNTPAFSFEPKYLVKEEAINKSIKINKYKLKSLYPKSFDELINYFNSYETLPQSIKRGTKTIPISKENIIEEIPHFKDKKIKGVCSDFILYI